MIVRSLVAANCDAVTAIYAHHVRHSTGTFEEVPPSPAEFATRIAKVTDAGWPWLVADDGAVRGYAYAAQFNPRSGYRHACEVSVYVAADALGRGIGTALLAALLPASRACGFTYAAAVIGDAENRASIALHARHGFVHAGHLHGIGRKFGRELDVIHMERRL